MVPYIQLGRLSHLGPSSMWTSPISLDMIGAMYQSKWLVLERAVLHHNLHVSVKENQLLKKEIQWVPHDANSIRKMYTYVCNLLTHPITSEPWNEVQIFSYWSDGYSTGITPRFYLKGVDLAPPNVHWIPFIEERFLNLTFAHGFMHIFFILIF